ncbi:MAG: secretin and TonB N-terminal domain-containing protein [Halanaerobium sp.]
MFKKEMYLKILTAVLILVLFTGSVLAQAEEEPQVSTVFFETDIREALNEISLQTGVNIVYDESVVGRVTLDLNQVPLEKALDMMLLAGGYQYRKLENNFYIVGSPDPDSPIYQRITESETIKLDYITASHAVDLLPSYYEDFIRSTDETDDMLTITAPGKVIESFKEHLAKIDNPEPEILIEVLVTEVSTEVIKERGMDLFGLTTESAAENYSLDYDGIFALQAAGPAGQLLSQIKLLEEQNLAEITANPSIRVSNKESANLFVGEERVLILELEDEDILEDVEVGVSLEVTPEVKSKDDVRIQISPDISNFTDEQEDQLIVRRSEITSTVRTKNNETITMAGMTLDEIVEYESKVPGLGDVPLIRWLFREESEKKGEREMLIFITPKIIGQ